MKEFKFQLLNFYSSAFLSKPSLDKDLDDLTVFRITQNVITKENSEKDSIYLTSLLRKLKKTKVLNTIIFEYTLSNDYDNNISETIAILSFGYFMYPSRLVKLNLTFDDLLNHQKASIWRAVEHSYRTLKRMVFKFYNEDFKLIPIFRYKKQINLDFLDLSGIDVTDLFLLSKFRHNWTIRSLTISSVEQTAEIQAEGKYFMDVLARNNINILINHAISTAISSQYKEIDNFIKTIPK